MESGNTKFPSIQRLDEPTLLSLYRPSLEGDGVVHSGLDIVKANEVVIDTLSS